MFYINSSILRIVNQNSSTGIDSCTSKTSKITKLIEQRYPRKGGQVPQLPEVQAHAAVRGQVGVAGPGHVRELRPDPLRGSRQGPGSVRKI